MFSVTLRHFAVRLAVATVLSFCQNVGSARAADTMVMIDNFTFEPAQLTVKVGTTVTWKNRDDIPHTVVSAGKFRSKVHRSRRLHLFLLAASAYDRDDQG
jgi:plastocyanin